MTDKIAPTPQALAYRIPGCEYLHTDTAYVPHDFAKLPPRTDAEHLAEIEKSICGCGIREPITIIVDPVTNAESIGDGRHRYEIGRHHGLAIPCIRLTITPVDVLALVERRALLHRHLDAGQRAAFAALIRVEYQRMKGSATSVGNFTNPVPSGPTAVAAGRHAQVSERYVRDATNILRQAPDILESLKEGDVSMGEAKQLASIPDLEQRARTLDELKNSPPKDRRKLRKARQSSLGSEDEATAQAETRTPAETLAEIFSGEPGSECTLLGTAKNGGASGEPEASQPKPDVAKLVADGEAAWTAYTQAMDAIPPRQRRELEEKHWHHQKDRISEAAAEMYRNGDEDDPDTSHQVWPELPWDTEIETPLTAQELHEPEPAKESNTLDHLAIAQVEGREFREGSKPQAQPKRKGETNTSLLGAAKSALTYYRRALDADPQEIAVVQALIEKGDGAGAKEALRLAKSKNGTQAGI